MKPRTALHILIGSMLGAALIFIASGLVAGQGSGFEQMVAAQRTNPILWLVDACGLAILGCMWFYSLMLNHFQGYLENQSNQHVTQLNEMIDRTSELENVNDEYADRVDRMEVDMTRQLRDYSDQISTLEEAAVARHQVFEMESRRISDTGYESFRRQLVDTSRQLEAMTMGIQFQRGELRRMREELRTLQAVVGLPQHPAIESGHDLFDDAGEGLLGSIAPQGSLGQTPSHSLIESKIESAFAILKAEEESLQKLNGATSDQNSPPSDWFGEYGDKSEARDGEWKSRASERMQTGTYLEELPETQRAVRTPMPLSNLQQYRKPLVEIENENERKS